ncbi:MAG: ParB/RepB/Spo0J family partition protein [Halobacteriovoraceae bacterium]|nr:ParB/RepB/Spo0J family partition protein [Halobacteriovoraceae bacterium]
MALGKGIASLIQQGSVSPPLAQETEAVQSLSSKSENPLLVSIDSILPNPHQPRKSFDEKELSELSDSIRENGVIQPLIVSKTDRGFDLIAGERRLKAAKWAGLEKVPVIVKRVTDREKMVMAIVENVQRSDLNCVEEALAYFRLMDDFNLTQEDVAKRLGKERSSVANYLRLLKLPREVMEMLQQNKLSFGHGKILASLKDLARVTAFARVAMDEQLSVRELEELVKRKEKSPRVSGNRDTDPKWDQLRMELEQKTGFHFAINAKKSGSGQVVLKFTNRGEFNQIYEYLLSK